MLCRMHPSVAWCAVCCQVVHGAVCGQTLLNVPIVLDVPYLMVCRVRSVKVQSNVEGDGMK